MEPQLCFETIRNRIINSNANASRNRNLYPIQEQATLSEIWEYVTCGCGSNCTCRKFGCSGHWKLRNDLVFNDILPAFLRTFVNKAYHSRLRDLVSMRLESVPPRIKGALSVLENMKRNWGELYVRSSNWSKTLICDNWCDGFWKNQWNFKVRVTSVYRAKQFCILLPDIGIPYDIDSRTAILSSLSTDVSTYFEMLAELRDHIVGILEVENQTLPNFRKLDAPQEQLPFDCNLVSLRKKDFDYGVGYCPEDRPISRIIDKCFYQPGDKEADRYRAEQPVATRNGQALYPSSGRGQLISWKEHKNGRYVYWGELAFSLPDDLINDILGNYFENSETWYPLGASMTAPASGGLGGYIQENHSLSPRYASAIAAVMVQDELIEFRGKRPIELRKICDREQIRM